jgi:hypothetical protein
MHWPVCPRTKVRKENKITYQSLKKMGNCKSLMRITTPLRWWWHFYGSGGL